MQSKFLAWLDPNPDLANERLERILDLLHSKFGSKRYLSNQDVDDLAQETLKRVIQKVEAGLDIRDIIPEAYVQGVANNVLKEKVVERRRRSSRLRTFHEHEYEQIMDSDENPEEHILTDIERERYLECLDKCLTKLTPEEYNLIELYSSSTSHWTGKLLKLFGGTSGKLRTKMHRLIHAKLKPCIEKCLNNQPVV